MRAFVIIPAYEPGETLVSLARELSEGGAPVIIVDDGSGKDKKAFFDDAARYAEVLTHPVNRGKGAAIKTALTHIVSVSDRYHEIAVAVTMDCDGQHLPSDAERVAAEAEANPGSFVLGVRKVGREMPVRSRFGNSVTRSVFRILSGVYVSDTQTGLRAFDLSLCPALLSVEGERYEYESNALMNFARSGIPFREVPVETIYTDRKNSVSHFRTFADSFRIYKNLIKAASSPFIRFAVSSLLSFCVDYLLFTVFYFFFRNAVLSNVVARVLSAAFNYALNCVFVFERRSKALTVAGYIALAAGILFMNSLLLVIYTKLGLHPQMAKFVTEITLFIISFIVQKFVVFRKKAE